MFISIYRSCKSLSQTVFGLSWRLHREKFNPTMFLLLVESRDLLYSAAQWTGSSKWYMITGTTPKSYLRSRPTRHIPIIIRPDTNFWHRPQISAPSEIKTQRNRVNCMRLNSPKVHLSKTIRDWLRPLRIVRLFMHFSANAPQMTVTLSNFCKQYLDRLYACLDAIKVLFTKLNQVTARYEGRGANRVLFQIDAALGKTVASSLIYFSVFLSRMERLQLGTMSKIRVWPYHNGYMKDGAAS